MRAIVVHGGAGGVAGHDEAARRRGVHAAATRGWAVLETGAPALDAVVAAVTVLEDDPHFNAGWGSVLTSEGTVELDASVMAGDGLVAGAVGAVRGVPNPVLLARLVASEGHEVLLVGDPATALARRHGLRVCSPDALVSTRARHHPPPGETVGAVARDVDGHLAAATSTGGVAGKRPGRVGDSALIGAGTYADDALGAASATGPGEAIIRVSLVRAALDLLSRGRTPEQAAGEALAILAHRTGATAGLILVAPVGVIAVAHTTDTMPTAHRTSDSAAVTTVG